MHILIVDDTSIVRHLLRTLLEERGHRVYEAESGEEAIQLSKTLNLELITMDVHMPGMDGIQATREIMRAKPTPILIVSGTAYPEESAVAIEALAAGALAVMEKPVAPWDPRHEKLNETLLSAIEVYANVPFHRARQSLPLSASIPPPITAKMIAIGASAGGPAALLQMMKLLGDTPRAPIVIIQHIAPGFISGFAEWLSSVSKLPVTIATDGGIPERSHVYLAPDYGQLSLTKTGRFHVQKCDGQDRHCPSINHFFLSIAHHQGKHTIAILLSGMGDDGAKGCQALAQANSTVLVQEPSTALVDSMPQKAITASRTPYVLTPEKIADYLRLCSR